MSRSVSFFRYIHDSLGAYRWFTVIFSSLTISGLFACGVFYHRVSSDRQVLRSVGPYLATLVESQDRPEMLRVLRSISDSQDSELFLIQDGIVLAAPKDLGSMDRPFQSPRPYASAFGFELVGSRLSMGMPIPSTDGERTVGDIVVFTPLTPMMLQSLAAAVLVFGIAFGLSLFFVRGMREAIQRALEPLNELHKEIHGLANEQTRTSAPIAICELEEIRQTILGTQRRLENTRDRLAEERAKKLSAESYKRMIHDLHTPVAALRQNARLLAEETTDAETRHEATQSIPCIVEQILRQIAAAKKNLDEQPAALRECDLRTCLEGGIQQVRDAHGTSKNLRIETSIPEAPVVAAHDPDLLRRAIMNLVDNGLSAAKSRIIVSLRAGTPGVGPTIQVADDGCGMDETEVALHLQGRGQSTKEPRQAFGLSSANHIVRTHGGRIIYRKSPDLGGACFEIRLGAV